MTTKSTTLGEGIKANESKLSHIHTHTHGTHWLCVMWCCWRCASVLLNVQVEKKRPEKAKKREKEKNFDDPMRIKVLDIVLPFLLCFNWSIKGKLAEKTMQKLKKEHTEKTRHGRSNQVDMSSNRLDVCVSLHTSSEFRSFFFLLSLWSMMKRSGKQNPTQNEQPKVLLASQSSRAGNKIYNQCIHTHKLVIDNAGEKKV